jgi:steroid delta-isomerase-like uncharacterized protein
MMTILSEDRRLARLGVVDEHIRRENEHDLDAIIGTFGATARYQDQAWAEQHDGHHGVRTFYADMLHALPDLKIAVQRRYLAEEAIVLEVIISGRHSGSWRGLPATGRHIEFPLCAVFTFDDEDRLAGERIYYDRATVLRQLGMFHEPESGMGRLTGALAHPITVARIIARQLRALAARPSTSAGLRKN